MIELSREAMGRPRWSGKSLDWKTFWLEWRAYWNLNSQFYSSRAKKWVFIGCLPGEAQEHMRAYVTQRNWGFKRIVEFYKEQSRVLVPDWQRLQEWRKCMPQGNDYLKFTSW